VRRQGCWAWLARGDAARGGASASAVVELAVRGVRVVRGGVQVWRVPVAGHTHTQWGPERRAAPWRLLTGHGVACTATRRWALRGRRAPVCGQASDGGTCLRHARGSAEDAEGRLVDDQGQEDEYARGGTENDEGHLAAFVRQDGPHAWAIATTRISERPDLTPARPPWARCGATQPSRLAPRS